MRRACAPQGGVPRARRLDERRPSPSLWVATRGMQAAGGRGVVRSAGKDSSMKIVDMSHVMNVHTPGWVGYAGNKMYYAQNLQTQTIVAQRIDTALHVGTHFDGAMHATDNRKGDMASLPLDYLVNRGVVVDISSKVSDWSVITPEIIEGAGADIREGDILILHTGWHRHYEGQL